MTDRAKWKTKTLGITAKEWMGLFVGIFLIMTPVIALFPEEISLWRKGLIILFMGSWFGLVLYCLLFITKSTREQDREEELLHSIEDYFTEIMEEGEIVETIIDELRNWTELPEELKYRYERNNRGVLRYKKRSLVK